MGTRSIVAISDADRIGRGRYAHWDGYPTGVGEALRQIVNRDTYAIAVDMLVRRHYGWSSIDGNHAQDLRSGYTDGRFKAVPGYGIAYTTEQGQSGPDEWLYLDDARETWCEWAYLLGEDGIAVFVPSETSWHRVGYCSYRDEAGMARIEDSAYAADEEPAET